MICELCKKEIIMDVEKYVQKINWDGKDKQKERFYHLICWNNFHAEKIKQELKENISKVMSGLNFGGLVAR